MRVVGGLDARRGWATRESWVGYVRVAVGDTRAAISDIGASKTLRSCSFASPRTEEGPAQGRGPHRGGARTGEEPKQGRSRNREGIHTGEGPKPCGKGPSSRCTGAVLTPREHCGDRRTHQTAAQSLAGRARVTPW